MYKSTQILRLLGTAARTYWIQQESSTKRKCVARRILLVTCAVKNRLFMKLFLIIMVVEHKIEHQKRSRQANINYRKVRLHGSSHAASCDINFTCPDFTSATFSWHYRNKRWKCTASTVSTPYYLVVMYGGDLKWIITELPLKSSHREMMGRSNQDSYRGNWFP